ncbi:hypothetical protein [Peribacillus simplex]|nr:hypothetical protein [Peribacillus simplex]
MTMTNHLRLVKLPVKLLQNIEVEMPLEAMRADVEASALRSNQRSNCTRH